MTNKELYFQLNNGQVVDIEDAAQAVQANEVDRLIGALSLVVLEARGFSRENKKRLAQFIFAAGEMVSERTRLDATDQAIFEKTLRDVAARKYG